MNFKKFIRKIFSKKAGKAEKEDGKSTAGKREYSVEEEKKIKQRLRDLGYLS